MGKVSKGKERGSNSMLRDAKWLYYNEALNNTENNTTSIWKTIKSLTRMGKNKQVIIKLKDDDNVLEDNEDIVCKFNSHFSTKPDVVHNVDKLLNFVQSKKDPNVSFVIPPITSTQVIFYVKKISPSKASGIDNISARFLRMAVSVIAPSTARLINHSFQVSVFLSRWKTAKVTLLHKGGDLDDISNYRPVSVLPVLSKVIEWHIYVPLYNCLIDNQLIYRRQSRF